MQRKTFTSTMNMIAITAFLLAMAAIGGGLGLAVQYAFDAPDRVFAATPLQSLRTPHFRVQGHRLAVYGVEPTRQGVSQVWVHDIENGRFHRVDEGKRVRGTGIRVAKITNRYVDFRRRGILTRVILAP